MGRGRFRGSALAAAACICVSAPPAAAAPDWLPPATLGAGSADLAVGTGSGGDSAAAWVDGSGGLVTSVRPAGGGFGAAHALSGAGAAEPDVAIADDGHAILAWRQDGALVYSTRPAGAANFGPPATLDGSGSPADVRVAVARGGAALLAYRDASGAHAALGSTSGGLAAPQTLTGSAVCGVRAALADSGHAAVAYGCSGGSAGLARRAPGAAFSAPEGLGTAGAVAVGVQDDGTTLVALEQGGVIKVAEARPGAAVGAPAPVSGSDAHGPELAVAGGEAWVAWRQGTQDATVAAARRPAGGSFEPGRTVSQGGVAGPVRLVGGGSGAFTLAWLRDAGEAGVLAEAARRDPPATGFSAPLALSPSGTDATELDLGGDPDGNALAGYALDGAVQVRPLDGAGPRLLAIDSRGAGFAGAPYPFSFDPADAWSAVAGAEIDFGDGTRVAARSAEHAYASPGDKTITFSATDSVGNASSTAHVFKVAPPPDRTAPRIRRASMDATRFRISGRKTPVAAAVRRGTRFRYRLSEPAQATIFFERVRMGRRRGGKCERDSRRGKRCRVYEPVGLITRSHPVAGRVSTGFSGRIVAYQGPLKITDIRLRPGRYRATLVAADAARNSSKPVQLAFTVLR